MEPATAVSGGHGAQFGAGENGTGEEDEVSGALPWQVRMEEGMKERARTSERKSRKRRQMQRQRRKRRKTRKEEKQSRK